MAVDDVVADPWADDLLTVRLTNDTLTLAVSIYRYWGRQKCQAVKGGKQSASVCVYKPVPRLIF